jgi:hypothetical protein
MAVLKEEKGDIEEQLNKLKVGESAFETSKGILDEVEHFLQDIGTEIKALPPRRKRALYTHLVKDVKVSRNEKKVECWIRKVPTVHPIIKEIEQEVEKTTARDESGRQCNSKVAGENTSTPDVLFDIYETPL